MVKRITWILAITGGVMFAAMTAVLLSGESHVRIPAIAAIVTFGIVVLSYLGGIEAGLALHDQVGSEKTRAGATPAHIRSSSSSARRGASPARSGG